VLVPPRDPAGLADALAAILGNPDRAHALGEAGRRRAPAFAPERVAQRFLDTVRLRQEVP
jgi:glycosyltransferase involved in cell wall biosynthesis